MTRSCWTALETHHARLAPLHLRQLFADDPDRFARLSASHGDMTVDFSKERLDADALGALLDLAREAGVEARRAEMFAGAHINATEDRAVLHAALRARPEDALGVDGTPTAALVDPVLEAFLGFADSVRSGAVTGAGGMAFTDVVNIGIGGSDLGPVMAVRALADASGPRVHFVSNVDGAHVEGVLAGLDPRRTLVIVASKTFTTIETMTNAATAKAWLAAAVGAEQVGAHLAALSTNIPATTAFGVPQERVFGFWDWVGGRYSLWSAIGLALAIAIGGQGFRAFLSGARDMDRHFREAPLKANLPVLLALVGIWRRNLMGCPTVALLPYDQLLERFPAYVQQLDMESNGKSVTRDGAPVDHRTGPVIWGEPGTNAQHSFMQLIHQGTDIVPVDFLLAAEPGSAQSHQHDLLVANCLAQSEALAFGKTSEEVRAEMAGKPEAEIARLVPHRTFPGNRPSTTIVYRRLDAGTLGRLIALFEHKVFVQGVIWNINSFDQWGVELGKVLAMKLLPMVTGEAAATGKDASTAGLLARLRTLRG